MTVDPAIPARWERRLRPFLIRLPPALVVRFYAAGRRRFAASLARWTPPPVATPAGHGRTLWGLEFRAPILNAAGMWKNGQGYSLVANQGAGGYLAGTTTASPRRGNRRHGVFLPFAPYPRSGAAVNWLGLPNDGHPRVARRLASLARAPGCPIGASVAACPDPARAEADKLEGLVDGLRAYDAAGVDFLELNESCPNTEDDCGLDQLEARLDFVRRRFLDRRVRRLPVVLKLSNDTPLATVPDLVALASRERFDGLNFGNTSTAYDRHRPAIAAGERALYDHMTSRFGGGLSGRPLNADALARITAARDALSRARPADEFHLIATGGIETAADVAAALAAGASLCGWYTGYFEAFGGAGHRLYAELLAGL